MRTGWPERIICISRRRVPNARNFSVSAPILDVHLSKSANADANTDNTPTSKGHIVLSGIQPTGIPHLGNYLGALRLWKDLQDESSSHIGKSGRRLHKLFFSVVDLHALTGSVSSNDRNRLRKETFASLLAIGLSSPASSIFFQSDVQYHTEFMWILSTIASTGYLSRMTQWKSKLQLPSETSLSSDAATEKLKVGLFTYPILQAADILLYKPGLVPVGEDQAQHIEFARVLARSFNAQFGAITPWVNPQSASAASDSAAKKNVFDRLPEPLISPARRVMSLRDPIQKMSKSHADPKSRILITDRPEEIRSKVRTAVTDSEHGISYSPSTRPGVSNLIDILKHTTRSDMSCEDIAVEHRNTSKQAFKELVGDEVIRSLAGISDRFEGLMKPGNEEMSDTYMHGKEHANLVAGQTMEEVREVVGLTRLFHKKDGKMAKLEF